MSDLIWGTDAAHTSAEWRPNLFPWKSYWATGLGVEAGGSGAVGVYHSPSDGLNLDWSLQGRRAAYLFHDQSAISGENCLVLLNSSHADVCWPCWFFASLDDLLICRLACLFFWFKFTKLLF